VKFRLSSRGTNPPTSIPISCRTRKIADAKVIARHQCVYEERPVVKKSRPTANQRFAISDFLLIANSNRGCLPVFARYFRVGPIEVENRHFRTLYSDCRVPTHSGGTPSNINIVFTSGLQFCRRQYSSIVIRSCRCCLPILQNRAKFRENSNIREWPYLCNGDLIHFMFGSRVGFSGTADRTALFMVRTNPRWRPPPCWKKFQVAISPQPVVRSTSCFVLGRGFRGRRI